MKKNEFLDILKSKLVGLPKEDVERSIEYYGEMIDDRIEDSMSEDEAVEDIGKIDDIVLQITSEIPLTRIVKEKVRPKRALRVWEIILIILGFPIWGSLAVALLCIILSVYIILWTVVVCIYAVFVSVGACSLVPFLPAVLFSLEGRFLEATVYLGAGVFLMGITVLLFFASIYSTKGTAKLSKKIFIGIKTLFLGKVA